MPEDFLGDRKRALEESFFKKQEAQLIERLRAQRAQQTRRQAIAEALGLRDDPVVDHLVDLGVEADTVLALRLVPLVEVAWADGHLDDRERRAVLAALQRAGIGEDSPAHALLRTWLAEPPPAVMLEAWIASTRALAARLDEADRRSLRADVIGGARAVAEAAGGMLGLGTKVSKAEEEMLRRLEVAFIA